MTDKKHPPALPRAGRKDNPMYNDKIEDLRFTVSLYPLEGETDLEALRRRDSYIAADIAEAKAIIRKMEEYRQEIFTQAQRIAAAPVSLELELVRSRRFAGGGQYRPFYYLTCYEVYAGIGKKKIRQEIFPGKERFKAIKLLAVASLTLALLAEEWKSNTRLAASPLGPP